MVGTGEFSAATTTGADVGTTAEPEASQPTSAAAPTTTHNRNAQRDSQLVDEATLPTQIL
jgi:hypothetical protein